MFHIKFRSIPSLVQFTLIHDPQFYGLEVYLSNILMIGLCCSNNRMVIFSKMEKKFISQPTRKGPYIYVVLIEVGWDGLKICQVFADFFQQKIFSFYFCRWRGLGVTQLVIFCGRHKCMTPKWFKVTTNLVIRCSNFFFNINSNTF